MWVKAQTIISDVEDLGSIDKPIVINMQNFQAVAERFYAQLCKEGGFAAAHFISSLEKQSQDRCLAGGVQRSMGSETGIFFKPIRGLEMEKLCT